MSGNKKNIFEETRAPKLNLVTEEVDSINILDKPVLGKLKGVSADTNEPTRNDRWYTRELWETVMSSDDFQEGMESHTFFGENDHPPDRVDPYIEKASIVLDKMEIQDDGMVYCEFLILGTPSGKILKTILDAGCNVGVSSRGLGEEIVREGKTIIEPNSYEFYGFDVVTTPAVKKARPTLTESKQRNKLVEMLKKHIESIDNIGELSITSDLISGYGLQPLTESLNKRAIAIATESVNGNKKQTHKQPLPTGNTKAENEVGYEDNAESKEIPTGNTKARNESAKTSTVNRREYKRAINRGIELKRECVAYKNALGQSKIKEQKLAKESKELLQSYEKKKTVFELRQKKYKVKIAELESAQKNSLSEIKNLKSDLSKALEKLTEGNAKIDKLQNEFNVLDEKYAQALTKVSKATTSSKKLKESVDSGIDKTKTLSEKLSKLEKENKRKTDANNRLMQKYVKERCDNSGLNFNAIAESLPKKSTLTQVDEAINMAIEKQNKIRKMPIAYSSLTGQQVQYESSTDNKNNFNEDAIFESLLDAQYGEKN